MDVFEMHFPEKEKAAVKKAYNAASVILEYGSGGSTVMAANLPNKRIFSVETDRIWSVKLQNHLDSKPRPSLATSHHANIGETGRWGRPMNENNWKDYYRYPMQIWDEPFFRHPDVVLIDGRLRAASFLAVLMRITKPCVVMFDDYRDRKSYHVVEKYLSPRSVIGRLAVFDAIPGLIPKDNFVDFYRALGQITLDGSECDYPAISTQV